MSTTEICTILKSVGINYTLSYTKSVKIDKLSIALRAIFTDSTIWAEYVQWYDDNYEIHLESVKSLEGFQYEREQEDIQVDMYKFFERSEC